MWMLLAREPGDLPSGQPHKLAGPHQEGEEPKLVMHGGEKSDSAIVARKSANKVGVPTAEQVERRAGAEGNADQQSTCRAQDRESVSQALDRIRQAAKHRRKERFTALLHHISVPMLRTAFYALKRDAAPGVDGLIPAALSADRYRAPGWLRAAARKRKKLYQRPSIARRVNKRGRWYESARIVPNVTGVTDRRDRPRRM